MAPPKHALDGLELNQLSPTADSPATISQKSKVDVDLPEGPDSLSVQVLAQAPTLDYKLKDTSDTIIITGGSSRPLIRSESEDADRVKNRVGCIPLSIFGGIRNDPGDIYAQEKLFALGFEQELERDYDFWANFGIGLCNIGTLPGIPAVTLSAMKAGGPSMYAWAWPLSGIFLLCMTATLGEMASSYPVAGAMFTWTFRMCRASKRLNPFARFLSWLNGCFLLVGHIIFQLVMCYQLAQIIRGIVQMYGHLWISNDWHCLWITWLILFLSGVIVSTKIVRSPLLWRVSGMLSIIGFFVVGSIMLAKTKELKPASYLFHHYNNKTGFSNTAYVYIIGWKSCCIVSGIEANAHMAEDTKVPSRTVPLAMFWGMVVSLALGWFLCCALFASGNWENMNPDIEQPVRLIANTVPREWALVVCLVIALAHAIQIIAQLLATSRFVFAMARESAIPFSSTFKKISASKQPFNAIWTVVLLAAPGEILMILSTSLVGTILLQSAGVTVILAYTIPLVVYMLSPKDVLSMDGRSQWTLRGFSRPVGLIATLFCILVLIVLCFPTGYPVTPYNASYAPALVALSMLCALVAWACHGNLNYAGPIKTSTRWTLGQEIELPRATTTSGAKVTTDKPAGPPGTGEMGRTARVFTGFPSFLEEGYISGERRELREMRLRAQNQGGETTTGWTSDLSGYTETETETETGFSGYTSSLPNRPETVHRLGR